MSVVSADVAPASSPIAPVWEPPADAGRRVGLSRSAMYLLMREGHVTWRQYRSRRLVNVASVLAYIKDLPGRDAS